MASTNIQTFPGKVGVSNTNPIHTLDIGSNVYIDDTAQTKLRIIGNIHASGVTVDGTITAIDSENLSVKDPIILLASGSTGTSDTGIIMKRADGDSNVAVFYDEGVGLKIGHTLSTAQDIHISVDSSNSLSTSIYGPVTVAHSSAQALVVQGGAEIADDFKVGASKLFVDVSESNVGIGTDAPLATLDVHGTANVGALTVVSISGDGSGLSSIQSSNVSDFASNVTRIGTLETDLGSNVTRIGTLETDLGSNVTRIGTLETDLGSNVTRITNLESSDMTIGGEKTFSSSLTVGGDVTVTDTTSGSAAGPEFSLYRNQTGTNGDYLGQLRFDGKHDGGNDQLYAKITGKIKKADQGGEDGVIETAIITDGSQRVSLRHTGDLFHIKKGTDFQVGETANLYVDTSTSRVGIGMSNPSYTLDVDGHINLSTGSTLKINGTDAVFSRWTASGSDIYRSSGNVGIGTTSPAAKFDVRGASHDPSIPTVHIGDNVADAGDYGMVNLVRDATSGGSKAHLAFIRNGNTIFGMGYYNNTNTFGLWPSFAGVTNTPAISIDTAGDIGIGTASPFAKLVIGSSASGSSDMDILGFRSINNTAQQRDGYKQRIGFYGKEEYNNNERLSAAIDCIYGDNVHIPTYPGTSSTNIAFTVHGRSNNLFEAMRIQHDGNVGIGTSSPTKSLEIDGTTLRHAYEYTYQDVWTSNNNQTFTIPVTGLSARGEMLVEAEVIQVAANSSSERMARVKGIITNYHTGTFNMTVFEGENATAFETYIVGTSGSAAGTFTMKYQPQAGYLQNVLCRLNLKIFIGGFTSSLGSLTRTDAGSNSALTAPTLNSAPKIFGGNVGIGTNNPLSQLDIKAVKGITTAATVNDLFSNATIRISGYAENADALCIGMLGTDTSGNSGNNPYAYIQNIWDTPSTARPLLLNPAGGNVGIGTTNPGYKLDVAGSFRVNGGYTSTFGNDGLLHINSRSTTYGSETVALQTTIDGRALTASNPGTHGGESRNVLALQPDGGYVGIGTPSPSYKLDVNGKTRLYQFAGSRSGTFSGSGTFYLPGSLEYGSTDPPTIGWEIHMVFGFTGTNHGAFYISGCQDNTGISVVGVSEPSSFRIYDNAFGYHSGTAYLTAKRETNAPVYYAKIILAQPYYNNVSTSSGGGTSRHHFMFESVGCHAGVGSAKYQGSGFFTFVSSSRRPGYIRLTCDTGSVQGNYMINPLTT